MPQITATRDLATASVTVQVTDMTAQQRLVRIDRNGQRPVRLLEGQTPNDGVLIVTDNEAALSGPVTYQAGTATATVRLDSTAPFYEGVVRDQVHVVALPFLAASILNTLAVTLSGESTTTEHPIIGREDTVGVIGPLALSTGRLQYLAASYAEAVAIRDVYKSGAVVMYRSAGADEGRQPAPAGDLYHVADSVQLDADVAPLTGEQYWTVGINLREKPLPLAPLVGSAGWTFDALTASGLTFDQLAESGSTFNQLTLGPPA
jgi:hypothetical protein